MRMSDLVRGIQRTEEAPPARQAPPARPAAGPAAPRADGIASRGLLRFPTEAPPAPPRVAPAPESPVRETAPSAEVERPEQLFGELHAFAERLPGLVRGGREFPWEWFQRLVERAIRSLQESAELFSLASNPPGAGADYLAAHLTRAGILSLRLGAGLGWDRERLVDLGMAAFVFDVGALESPDQTHAQRSADIVRRWAPPRPEIIEAVLQHHERENGKGYPRGLAGSAIHPDAKIIGLADTYTSLIFPRPPGRALPAHEAIRDLVRSRHEGFSAGLIKALLAEISLFPPRTVVRLNTGEVGRVIAINRQHPLRPKVAIHADSKGSRLAAPKILDLSEAPFIYVTGPVPEGGES